MREIIFKVPGKVHGKARPRFSNGHTYTPARTRTYERKIRQAYKDAGGILLAGPLHVDIEIVYGIQKSATKAQQARRLIGDELAMYKPDVDNVEKVVFDALNGIAYKDDVCIVSTRTIKGRYEQQPRLIVRIRELDAHEITDVHRWMWDE